MATPIDAGRIEMEGRAAPSKPSQSNLRGWIASRNPLVVRQPGRSGRSRCRGASEQDRRSLRMPLRLRWGLPQANRHPFVPRSRAPYRWGSGDKRMASPRLRGPGDLFGRTVLSLPAPAIWGAVRWRKDPSGERCVWDLGGGFGSATGSRAGVGRMASYHLSVKTIKRSAGRSATAAAAYRAGEAIACDREGRMHDYTAKQGITETFIVAPDNAPDWVRDRAALWNAAEERETRKNSVTAREWELALPSEISAEERSGITRAFAEQLVSRYGVAVDVAIHAPHREGDQRNHHAHVLTTTRRLEPEGFTDKTRVLDAAKMGGDEIAAMRGVWADLQNQALERAGEYDRVDHRSLEAQREEALERGDTFAADALDRDPEVKLGPAANAIERREQRAAAREGRDYAPVTERGAVVHAARQARELFADMRKRLELARETYDLAREDGQGRVSAGLAALRAAAAKDLSRGQDADDIRDRLSGIMGGAEGGRSGVDALRNALDRDRDGQEPEEQKGSIRERLQQILQEPSNTPDRGADVSDDEEADERLHRRGRERDLSDDGWGL